MLQLGSERRSDIAVVVTYDKKRKTILDYYHIPGFLLTNWQQMFFDVNPVDFEAFRSSNLDPLASLLRQEMIDFDTVLRPGTAHAVQTAAPKPLSFNTRNRSATSRRILKGFARCSRRLASFVSRFNTLMERQRELDHNLLALLQDKEFF